MTYLIEFRFSGYPYTYLKKLRYDLNNRFRFTGYHRKRYVPHITIVPPITLHLFKRRYIKRIQKTILSYAERIHERGELIKTGKPIFFDTPEGAKVLALEIKPTQTLQYLADELQTTINKGWFSKCITYPENLWHATIAISRNPRYHSRLREAYYHLKQRPPQRMKFIMDRITILNNGRIVKEIDLVDKQVLRRIEALDRSKRRSQYLKIKEELKAKGEKFEY